MGPSHSAIPTLRPALEIVPFNPDWQLVWPKFHGMTTRPALHLDVGAAGRKQGVSGQL